MEDGITYQHVYQNTVNGYLLFYTPADRIVFITIMSVLSARYGIKIIAVSLMPDHYHLLVEAPGRYALINFIRTLDSVYAKAFNRSVGRHGRLFNKDFGCAPKRTPKEIISCINYILNNPLVKFLDDKVETSRWNYLAYALSKNPFSRPLKLYEAGTSLLKAVKGVDTIRNNERWMTYDILNRMNSRLSPAECLQLEDYIISSFLCADYDKASMFYGSLEKMALAANYNSGSEYAFAEDMETKDDRAYKQMTDYLLDRKGFKDIKDVLSLEIERRIDLAIELRIGVCQSTRQVEKFLLLPDGTLYLKREMQVRVRGYKRVHKLQQDGTCPRADGQVKQHLADTQ